MGIQKQKQEGYTKLKQKKKQQNKNTYLQLIWNYCPACQRILSNILQYLCEGQVDPVSQWSDDKSSIESHVLISIAKGSSALADDQLIRFFLPVEPQLTLPFKLTRIHDAAINGERYDIFVCMSQKKFLFFYCVSTDLQ